MKIFKEEKKDKTAIEVLDYSTPQNDNFHSESWEFFEETSNKIIKQFSLDLVKKFDGIDSSRWVYEKGLIFINFEFDDMLGTTITVNTNVEEAHKFINNYVNILLHYRTSQ